MIGRIAGQGGGGSFIKSVQQGQVTMGSTTSSVTINEVDNNYSIVIAEPQYTNSTSSDADENRIMAKVNTPTSIYFRRSGSSYITYSYWQVIEFEPSAIKSIQLLDVYSSASSAFFTIDEVDMNKTVIFGSHRTSHTYDEIYYYNGAYLLNDSTTVYFKSNVSATRYHYIYVVEFN